MNTYDNTPTSQALAIEARSVTQRANQANIQTLDAEAAKAATKAGPQPGFTAPMKVASETQKERPHEQPNQGKAATPHESQAQAGRTPEAARSRPHAYFDENYNLVIRASAMTNCRRALWYTATGQEVTNPRDDQSYTIMEAGTALEPVVLRAMSRSGWKIISPKDQPLVSIKISGHITVNGHPDAMGLHPQDANDPEAPLSIIEVKTRGPEPFKRWQTLGSEVSHPDAAAQAAFYTLAAYQEPRDAVIASMNTGSREWDYEVIPSHRIEQAFYVSQTRLQALEDHLLEFGPDPTALPDYDHRPSSIECKRCPYFDICQKPNLPSIPAEQPAMNLEPVSQEQAVAALHDYEELQESIRQWEKEKKDATETLKRYLVERDLKRAKLQGKDKPRSISLVETHRFSTDYKQLNSLLDPETRKEIVSESSSEYLRVG